MKARLAARRLARNAPQAQQPHENVLPRVLVREERLPAAVGGVVAPQELHLVGGDRVVDVLNAHLARAHVAAAQAEVRHARERELAQVALLHAARHEGHGDVALDAVNAHPRRHERKHTRHELDQALRRVALVKALLPELVEARAADDERGVQLEAVRPARVRTQ